MNPLCTHTATELASMIAAGRRLEPGGRRGPSGPYRRGQRLRECGDPPPSRECTRGGGRRRRKPRRRKQRAAPRCAFHDQGKHRLRRITNHARRTGAGRFHANAGCCGRCPHEARRRHRARAHQPPRDGRTHRYRQSASRSHTQPVEWGTDTWWVERRRSGGPRHGDDADRHRQRHRGLAAEPRLLLRHRVAQADGRAHPAGGGEFG